MRVPFPMQHDGTVYLTEGGQETEIMYKFGYDLPHFVMFHLLDDPKAAAELRGMYQRYLDTVARHGFCALMGGLDYRASPDWAQLLGYSTAGLAEMQHRSIAFLRDLAQPYVGQIQRIHIAGIVGPRGDAYSLNQGMTADQAQEYHSVQLETLKAANVDLASAMTFNSVAEAVGVSRAAAAVGLPITVAFTLDSTHRLQSGPSLKEAVLAVDAEAGDDKPDFYGVNCSHPYEFDPALETGDWIQRVRSLRPNAAALEKVALCTLGHLEEGDPIQLGVLAGELARRFPHIDVWGGCCGTWETHLEEIARNVAAVRRDQAPTMA